MLLAFSSCENQDWSFPDYGRTTVYFAYQYPVRTIVLGNDEIFDNTLDNQHKCLIKAVMGGVYDNGTTPTVDIDVVNSLCDNLTFATGGQVVPMPSNYYTLASDQIVIPKGQISAGVEVQLTDAFFADPKSIETTYVIPLCRMPTLFYQETRWSRIRFVATREIGMWFRKIISCML